jgi:hypothetical protein
MAGTLPVLAEQHATSPFVDTATVETNADLRASELIGMSVYNTETLVGAEGVADADTDWDRIGEISDVILSRSGDMEAVLLDVGGFLGIGERTVAVNLADLKMVSDSDDPDDFFVVLQSDRATVENAPEFDTDVIGAWNASGVSATALGSEQTAPYGSTIDTSSEGMAADDDSMMEPAIADDAGVSGQHDGFMPADSAAMTAEQLEDAGVYDGEENRIGEISEVIVTDDGTISEVIVDVGGFLGIGEKSVSLPFDDLNLQQREDGDEVRAYVSSTKEQLESMPEHEM